MIDGVRHLSVMASDSWFNQPEECKPYGDSYFTPKCLDNRYDDVANNNGANLDYIMNQAVVSAIPSNVLAGGLVGLYLPIAFLMVAIDSNLKPSKDTVEEGWEKRNDNIFLQAYWWTIEYVQEITMSKWIFFPAMWNEFIGIFGAEGLAIRVADYDFYNMSSTDMLLKLFASLFLWIIWLALDVAAFSIVAPYYAVWYTFNNWGAMADEQVKRGRKMMDEKKEMMKEFMM
jgi:hypothetical protein